MTCKILTQSLHNGWTFKQAGSKKSYPAVVPGCIHSDLLRNHLIPDPFYGRNERDLEWIEKTDWEYSLRFTVSQELLDREMVELVADGLDTVATLTLNGEKIAHTENMFVGHRLSVKDLLKKGENTLGIVFHNHVDAVKKRRPEVVPMSCDYVGGREQLRKQQCASGWDWGPRLKTSGIWRGLRLEAWSANRIDAYTITQIHHKKSCILNVKVDPVKKGRKFSTRCLVKKGGETIATTDSMLSETAELKVSHPERWWPNQWGDQPLYEVCIQLMQGERVLDSRSQIIGLCEIELDQHPDKWGTTFQFKINGKAIFIKGANWIPAHSFVNEGEALIPDLLDSAVEANMNMLRVWGGGIYELESFYEGCLKRGLLVWQDFQFACCTYPADPSFIKEVKAEAIYQIKRLRNYSNIALWCGNNEIEQLCNPLFNQTPPLKREYERIFHKLLPRQLEKLAPGADYISSSEHNPDDTYGDSQNSDSGDAHYWGVWHSRKPITSYEDQFHRFFSEFGMQAYPHVETAGTFTDSKNLFSPEMDNHQKNGGGNAVIFHYISELYRFPKDYKATVYLSQIMQAYCLRFGIEHMRRNMPRTMGSLFWQLNDCWPVASWSSIDFGGRWKALQYAAKRFYAPALVSVKWIGNESVHRSTNTLLTDVRGFEIHSIYDAPKKSEGQLEWELWSINLNKTVKTGSKKIPLIPGKSVLREKVMVQEYLEKHQRNDLLLRTKLYVNKIEVSGNTTFLTTPKRIAFQTPDIKALVTKGEEKDSFNITLQSDKIAYQVYLNLNDAVEHRISDNFFDLFPGADKQVVLRPLKPMTLTRVRKLLTLYSYRDSYLE